VEAGQRDRCGPTEARRDMFESTQAFSSFAVPDTAEAQRFYGETLGVKTEVYDEDNGILALHLAGGHDVLVYRKPDFEPATYTTLNFQVDDIDAAVDALGERGVSFERYEGFEQDEKGIAHGPGPKIAWFKDPAGNILSVLQQP
jgi:predicted enzyme related to lactoylglutathione lyase